MHDWGWVDNLIVLYGLLIWFVLCCESREEADAEQQDADV